MANLQDLGSNKRADDIAKKLGYSDAEALKRDYKGSYGSEWNIKYDTSTKELILVKIRDSSATENTGLYMPSGF